MFLNKSLCCFEEAVRTVLFSLCEAHAFCDENKWASGEARAGGNPFYLFLYGF
jgi:hypothetical protein